MERTVNKPIEIWIRGRKFCETKDADMVEEFERIVRKAGYETKTIHKENGRLIKIV